MFSSHPLLAFLLSGQNLLAGEIDCLPGTGAEPSLTEKGHCAYSHFLSRCAVVVADVNEGRCSIEFSPFKEQGPAVKSVLVLLWCCPFNEHTGRPLLLSITAAGGSVNRAIEPFLAGVAFVLNFHAQGASAALPRQPRC